MIRESFLREEDRVYNEDSMSHEKNSLLFIILVVSLLVLCKFHCTSVDFYRHSSSKRRKRIFQIPMFGAKLAFGGQYFCRKLVWKKMRRCRKKYWNKGGHDPCPNLHPTPLQLSSLVHNFLEVRIFAKCSQCSSKRSKKDQFFSILFSVPSR